MILYTNNTTFILSQMLCFKLFEIRNIIQNTTFIFKIKKTKIYFIY